MQSDCGKHAMEASPMTLSCKRKSSGQQTDIEGLTFANNVRHGHHVGIANTDLKGHAFARGKLAIVMNIVRQALGAATVV